MEFHEKLQLAIKLAGGGRGALSSLARSIGVSRQRIFGDIKNKAKYGAVGFEKKIDAYIELNK
jgi:hypothetical protein